MYVVYDCVFSNCLSDYSPDAVLIVYRVSSYLPSWRSTERLPQILKQNRSTFKTCSKHSHFIGTPFGLLRFQSFDITIRLIG